MGFTELRKALWLVPLVVTTGCVVLTIPDAEPPAEAVLSGTWKVEPDQAILADELLWVFNEFGVLVEIRYKATTILGEAQVTESNPVSSTSVEGNNVTVAIGGDSTFNFTGTMNEAQDRIEGTLSINWTLFNTDISIDQGAATLIKQ